MKKRGSNFNMNYILIKNNNLLECFCEEENFEDIVYDEVGCNAGKRYSSDRNFLIIEDNCLEGDIVKVNKNFFERGILYGTCIISKPTNHSLTEEEIRNLHNEIQINK